MNDDADKDDLESDEPPDLEVIELAEPEVPDPPQRFGWVPIRYLLPNLITLLALCSGVTAIRLGIEGRYELAAGAVILAAILDALDGRVARFLKGASRFGAELDSLADFVNFGVTPAVLLYAWSLHELKNLGWIVALGLAVCCALRLARFNVALDDPNKPKWMINYFTGIPAPAGAALAMLPMYLGFLGFIEDPTEWSPLILPYVALVAAGMISRLPTYSGKGLSKRVRRDQAVLLIGAATLFAVLLISYPWECLTVLCLAYIGLIPLGVRSYRRRKAADAAGEVQPTEAM